MADSPAPARSRRPVRWQDKGPEVEEAESTQPYGYSGAMGRSTLRVTCPFCEAVTTVYVWSFSGCGKRCRCGALLGWRGAIRWKPTP